MCISPTKTQLSHSLQTFQFGLSAKRVENIARRNVITNNSEETLKLLIQEYQSRLASAENERDNDRSRSEYEDLKAENKMLLEQLQQKVYNDNVPLLTFALNDREEVDTTLVNIPKPLSETEIVKECIQAVKVKCKESFMWKKEAERLRELNKRLIEGYLDAISIRYECV